MNYVNPQGNSLSVSRPIS